MRLPKTYFENLTTAKYQEYLKLLPGIEKENTKLFFTLALTFFALSFFGIFAINPTLTTIEGLKKELADNIAVEEQLQTKINNLSQLHQAYSQLSPDLPLVSQAIPSDAQATLLSAQVIGLAKKNNITVTTYRVAEVQLESVNKKTTKPYSFIFTLQADGTYDNLINFATGLTRITRIITVESMSFGRDTKTSNLTLTLRGRQYFK